MTQAPLIGHCDGLSRGGTCHFAGRRAVVICPPHFRAFAHPQCPPTTKEKRMATGPERQSLQDLLHDEMIDGIDEELELEIDDDLLPRLPEKVASEMFPADAWTAGAISRSCCACSASW